MAYRRRHGITRSTTFKEEIHHPPSDDNDSPKSLSATKASEANHHSPFSFASGESAFAHIERNKDSVRSKSFAAYGDSNRRDSKSGFWGVLARKAKAIIEDENASEQFENDSQTDSPISYSNLSREAGFTNVNDEIGKAICENPEENIHESWKLQVKRKGGNHSDTLNESFGGNSSLQRQIQQQNQTNHETQLKASRDVAMATAAKAKLLLRELKTVKADLAFAKLRCSQLEEENKVLREGREKGGGNGNGNAADDDLIRLQLEALLGEKTRLAHENETYARENRFLREIVEYHQLTMQDVVYLNEGIIEEEEDNNEAANYPIQQQEQVVVSTSTLSASPPREEEEEDQKTPPQQIIQINSVSQNTIFESTSTKEDQKRPS